ncbi:hypothetical protein ACFE04_014917 [Oxalis oulophora]
MKNSDQPPQSSSEHSTDYAPYPKLDANDVAPLPQNWTDGSQPRVSVPAPTAAVTAPTAATTMPTESNPYISAAPVHVSSAKSEFCTDFDVFEFVWFLIVYVFDVMCVETVDTVKDVLGKWGKKASDATKKAEVFAGDMWQHLNTGPSFADAAVSRIAQGTKVLTEGGYEKIFRQTFETVPEEKLLKAYACYLSTSAGPVMGMLYLSTAKLAFSSDTPLSYKVGEETQWSFYKVVIQLHQLKGVNASTSKKSPAEKYIQVISVDNHEFWFMGFVYYDSALKSLQGALQRH